MGQEGGPYRTAKNDTMRDSESLRASTIAVIGTTATKGRSNAQMDNLVEFQPTPDAEMLTTTMRPQIIHSI